MLAFYIFCIFCIFCPLSPPCFGHGDDIAFKAKFKKIPTSNVDIKGTGIETKIIKEEIVDDIVRTTGQIEEIPNNKFDVNSPVQGKVISVLVDLGTMVQGGQGLATIQSTEIAKLQSELNQSEAELELAKNNFDREEKLFEKRITAKKDLDVAKAALASAEAKLTAARNNLKILTNQNENLEQGIFTIKTPKAGTIVERNITIGQVVNVNQIIFRGLDLTKVWASADIYEKDRSKINKNQKAIVILDGAQDKAFTGNITYIGSVINKETRTLPVKVLLDNKESVLNPGAFIQLNISTGQKKNLIVIPRTALAQIDKEGTEGKHKHIVYLKEGKFFIPRKIEVEAHDSDTVEVISGLTPGEVIVSKGTYQLEFGEGEEEHEHIKQEKTYPKWLIPVGFLITLIVGFLLGKKKPRTSL
ncbi:MAG: efflux RND transporter periplasmic adaptor subunit [Candidatus Melainabacteria bacterium]|nr:efflux RND transporter periplasmic adaptor subunit [Candidatus Melainabacteria bacterium]